MGSETPPNFNYQLHLKFKKRNAPATFARLQKNSSPKSPKVMAILIGLTCAIKKKFKFLLFFDLILYAHWINSGIS